MNQKAVKSITIHGLDYEISELISEKARQGNTSLNQTIKILLQDSLGITANTPKKRQANFSDIFGKWTKADEKEFNSQVKRFERIDHEDWQ